MELYELEKFFNHKFNHDVRIFPGLFYKEVNEYFIYNCNITKNSFIVVILPYHYYFPFIFHKNTFQFLKKNMIRCNILGELVNHYGIRLYDDNK